MNNTNTQTVSSRQRNFNIGYNQAMKGAAYNPALAAYAGYAEGWDAGNSDRPSLDDLTLDIASERSNPLGY